MTMGVQNDQWSAGRIAAPKTKNFVFSIVGLIEVKHKNNETIGR